MFDKYPKPTPQGPGTEQLLETAKEQLGERFLNVDGSAKMARAIMHVARAQQELEKSKAGKFLH